MSLAAGSVPLVETGLRGEEIRFSVIEGGARREFVGRINGAALSGSVKSASQSVAFTATRR